DDKGPSASLPPRSSLRRRRPTPQSSLVVASHLDPSRRPCPRGDGPRKAGVILASLDHGGGGILASAHHGGGGIRASLDQGGGGILALLDHGGGGILALLDHGGGGIRALLDHGEIGRAHV